MEKRKVLIVDGSTAYSRMFTAMGWSITDNMHEADLVQFTGGEDVSPLFYKEANHPRTGNNINRDLREKAIYEKAQELGIACTGICRGGQFLNVMNGGKMFQHVDGHATGRGHTAYMYGYMFPIHVTSTHHQMMRPNYDADVHVLMTAGESTFKEFMGTDIIRMETKKNDDRVRKGLFVTHLPDIESLYYPDSNTLCFQPHPEFAEAGLCREAYFHLINNYLFDEEGKFEWKAAS